MINLFDKTNVKKNVNNQWKDVKSEKIKTFPLVCSKYLSSWTGLGRSGHVRFPALGSILHVLGPKMSF